MKEIKIEIPESILKDLSYKHENLGWEDLVNLFDGMIQTGLPCKLNVKITKEPRNESE